MQGIHHAAAHGQITVSYSRVIYKMSDKAKSKSLPVLLCGEEDVEGSHGVSSGKVDESKLFYLMSRGFSEKQAKRLIISANLTKIINNIPDELIKEEVNEYLDKKIGE